MITSKENLKNNRNIALKEYRSKVASGEIERGKNKNPIEKFEENPTPLNALKAKCFECCNGQREEIKHCPITDCALYNFRPYK